MMKTIVCLSIVVMLSCNNKPTNQQVVQQFANLECRAIQLRKQRFALANTIRNKEDSISMVTDPVEKLKLKNELLKLSDQKQQLVNESLALADSIKPKLDKMMQENFTTIQQKQEFSHLLNEELKRKGCVENE